MTSQILNRYREALLHGIYRADHMQRGEVEAMATDLPCGYQPIGRLNTLSSSDVQCSQFMLPSTRESDQ